MAKQAKYQEGQQWSGTYRGANTDEPVTITITNATQRESKFKFDTHPAYTVDVNWNGKVESQHMFESELEQELRIIGAQ